MASTVKQTINRLRKDAKLLDSLQGKTVTFESRNLPANMREAAELLAVTDYGYRAICATNDRLQETIRALTETINAANLAQK